MFDNNVFCDNSLRNFDDSGVKAGYELETLITYYRAIPLSMIEYIRVFADGIEEKNENITISVDKVDWFTLSEAETVTTYKWEYGDPLYIRVKREGGLSSGEHTVKLTVATRTAYVPVPFEGTMERRVSVK